MRETRAETRATTHNPCSFAPSYQPAPAGALHADGGGAKLGLEGVERPVLVLDRIRERA